MAVGLQEVGNWDRYGILDHIVFQSGGLSVKLSVFFEFIVFLWVCELWMVVFVEVVEACGNMGSLEWLVVPWMVPNMLREDMP